MVVYCKLGCRNTEICRNNENTKVRWWKVEIWKPRWWKINIVSCFLMVSLFRYFDFSPSYYRLFIIVPSHFTVIVSLFSIFIIVLSRFHHRNFVFSLSYYRVFRIFTIPSWFLYFDFSLSYCRVFCCFDLYVCRDGPNGTPCLTVVNTFLKFLIKW